MSTDSPVSVLYSSDGSEIAIVRSVPIPDKTRTILISGTDGVNARTILTDAYGEQIIVGAGAAGSPIGGVITIQGIIGGTPLPISGSISATNPSVSTTGIIAPSSITYIGGNATSSSPSYINNTVNGLSLTLSGALRTDSSSTIQPVSQSGSWTVISNIGTTGDLALDSSLQTIDADIKSIQPRDMTDRIDRQLGIISGTVFADQGTANNIDNAWPTFITDGYNILGTEANPMQTDLPKSSTTNINSVDADMSGVLLLSANPNRIGAAIYNNSPSVLYVKLGVGATTNSYTVQIPNNGLYEIPFMYVGQIDGVWQSATGFAQITEFIE